MSTTRLDGNAPTSIREAVCSFANDLAGLGQPGVVFVGVKDNGEPMGIDVTDQMLTQLSDIKTDGNIVPPPSMLVEKRGLRGMDVVPNAFSAETLEANERSAEQRLATTKMIASSDVPTATVLGLLVLGKRPRDYIPNSYVEFLRIDGVELSDSIIDHETIDGTIPEILRRIDDKMKAHISTGVDLTSFDTELRESTYPLAALQQVTRNAVMHRAYEATHAPVRITWFNNRIEVHNPGGAFGAVTREVSQADHRESGAGVVPGVEE